MAGTENSNEAIGMPAFASYSITFITNTTSTVVQFAGADEYGDAGKVGHCGGGKGAGEPQGQLPHDDHDGRPSRDHVPRAGGA
jgi:hypothetical protein